MVITDGPYLETIEHIGRFWKLDAANAAFGYSTPPTWMRPWRGRKAVISLDGVIQVSDEDGDVPYSDWTAPYRTAAGRDAIMRRPENRARLRARFRKNHLAVVKRHVRIPAQHYGVAVAVGFAEKVLVRDRGVLLKPFSRGPSAERAPQRVVYLT